MSLSSELFGFRWSGRNVAPLDNVALICYISIIHLKISPFSQQLVPSLFFRSFLPSFPLSLALPGVVAMAGESAQMAGQLAFRGRAPQLKLPQFFIFASSLFFGSNFWLATFHCWRAFISLRTI